MPCSQVYRVSHKTVYIGKQFNNFFKGPIPFWTPHTGENHLSLVMHNHLLLFIQMQLGHNSSQASISWCPGSPSWHNGPIICMPTRKAQSSQCYSVCLIVVSSPGNVGLQQIQHTAYSRPVCALIVEHRAFVMQPGQSHLWRLAIPTHTLPHT